MGVGTLGTAMATGVLGKPGHVIVAWLNSPEQPRHPALADLVARRHQPRPRPLPRPHRRLRLDGRLGQALVDLDSPSAGLRAGAGGLDDAIHTATATDMAATAA